MTKPLLIGETSPFGREALAPYFPGCSGWRLWKMMADLRSVTQAEFSDMFDRTNLDEPHGAYEPSVFFLLGERVRMTFAVPKILIHPQVIDGRIYRCIPHPSGRNLFYNEKENRDLVGRALLEEAGKW